MEHVTRDMVSPNSALMTKGHGGIVEVDGLIDKSVFRSNQFHSVPTNKLVQFVVIWFD